MTIGPVRWIAEGAVPRPLTRLLNLAGAADLAGVKGATEQSSAAAGQRH